MGVCQPVHMFTCALLEVSLVYPTADVSASMPYACCVLIRGAAICTCVEHENDVSGWEVTRMALAGHAVPVGSDASVLRPLTTITFQMDLQRNSRFYVVACIIPAILIVLFSHSQ